MTPVGRDQIVWERGRQAILGVQSSGSGRWDSDSTIVGEDYHERVTQEILGYTNDAPDENQDAHPDRPEGN